MKAPPDFDKRQAVFLYIVDMERGLGNSQGYIGAPNPGGVVWQICVESIRIHQNRRERHADLIRKLHGFVYRDQDIPCSHIL